MLASLEVNSKDNIKRIQHHFHCFKLNETYYAVFDIKMDMPVAIESLSVITSMSLPKGAMVFYYELQRDGYFEKPPDKFIEIKGDITHQKAPLRYNILDNKHHIFHHFKISPVLFVLFDERFDMPIMYGSNQKVAGVIHHIPKTATIFYYKEDLTTKNSYKLYMTYKGKRPATESKPVTEPTPKSNT